jgi:hypothetical protein
MRTHLLHTVHVPPAAEPETGFAANDPDYMRRESGAVPTIASPESASAQQRRAIEDDYALGGYAGI